MRVDYLKLLLATVLFGSYLVASKLILREVPVFTATLVRLLSAALVLACYVRARGMRVPRLGARDVTVVVVQAAFGMLLFSVLAMYGVQYTGAIESGVILSMVPVGTSIVALVFLREHSSATRIGGILVAVCGIAGITVFGGRSGGASHAVLGAVLLLGAVACEVVFLTFGKLLSQPVSPAMMSLLLSVLGAALVLFPALHEMREVAWSHVSWGTWLLMIYTGVAINGIAVVLMYDGMNRIETSVVSAFTALTPVSGTVLSVIFTGEALHVYHLGGIAMVVAGVFIVLQDAQRAKLRSADDGRRHRRCGNAWPERPGKASHLPSDAR
jgi:drug/metabolite transporter (DMT)-like permease